MGNNRPAAGRVAIGQRVAGVLAAIVLVLYLGILALDLILDRRVRYWGSDSNVPLAPNWVLLLIAAGIVAVVLAVRRRRRPEAKRTSAQPDHPVLGDTLPALVATLALLCYQAASFKYAGFYSGWDTGAIRGAVLLPSPLSQSLPKDAGLYFYFSTYPNNIFLVIVLRAEEVIRRTLFPWIAIRAFLSYVSIVLVSASFFMFTRISGRLLSHGSFSGVTDAVFFVLVGMSPWYMIPYSDTYSLFLCTLMLWVVVCAKPSLPASVALGALGGVAYNVKPTCIFVVLAAIVAWLLVDLRKETVTTVLKRVAAVIASLALALCLVSLAIGSLGISWNEDARFGMSHFAMMGLNDKTDGVFSQDDVNASIAEPNVDARRQMNLRVIGERISSYGPVGLLKHECKKTLVSFNDGTFAWTAEGHFFLMPHHGSFGEGTNFFRSYIYPEGYYKGPNFYNVFCTVEQTLWLVCLAGIPLCLLARRTGQSSGRHSARGNGDDASWAIIIFTLGAMALFLMVFEARSRYLYLYAGYFVLLGMHGFQALAARFGDR
ncbi:MAG: hypothetical protein ACI38Z_07785 [Parafannyhessea sp.]|uniref:hypothetical protein n=1 Tax=Parafannyhessea sp. TaxID=2847324 RepID=UPI003F101B3C